MVENKPRLHTSNLVKSISHLLSVIVSRNSDCQYDPNDPFAAKDITTTTIQFYLKRIEKYTKMEQSTMILTLIYIDQLCEINSYLLNPYNIHRILLACCLISIKYNEDEFYDNKFYSQVGGVPLKELNRLEYQLIQYLDYSLFVSHEQFTKYANYLKDYCVKE